MLIDLRSDTVTQPTPAMRDAMFTAPLGDDVLGDDPTVNALEAKAARLFGVEAALFCASGTMTNQLAIRTHTRPGDDVICDYLSHVYQYEGGGIAVNALASTSLAHGNRGKLTPDLVREHIYSAADSHKPLSRLVVLENTVNKGGGCYYTIPEIAAIRQVCDEYGLILHLDGARLFNALVETGEPTAAYGKLFDSISICLSKGLGCPVGSLLLGKADFIGQARRYRKLMGGGWRQAGFLAAAGIYALDHHIERLRQDHARARQLGALLKRLHEVEEILPIDTNIVIFRLPETLPATDYVARLESSGIRGIAFGKHLVRFVTHLDITDEHLQQVDLIPEITSKPPVSALLNVPLPMPTLLVVDDHQVAISGIRHALAGLPDFTIIAQTANGYEALQVLETTSPDMVITDLYLGDETLGGIELAEIIRQKYPSIRTLMFSSETRKSQVLRRAYQAGIAGYVPKTAPLQELVLALTAISQGKTYFSPDILEKIVDTLNVKTDLLTPTEKRILDLLAQGKSRKEITQQILNRSGNTYDTHFQSIKRKLEVKTTPELITKAIRMGLLAVDEP